MRIRHILIGGVVLGGVVVAAVDRLDIRLVPQKAAGQPAPPPFLMPVPFVPVRKASVPVTLDYSARTESIRAITLQAKVSAYLADQPMPDGADVKAGDLLYRLDPRDFRVALDQAKAQSQRDSASLDYQRSTFQRSDSLSKSGWLAKDSFDERTSTLHQAEASLAASRAAEQGAALNLSYTEIRAPFAGRLGRNQAPVGTLVGAGGTVLNTLVQLDPIYVTFNPSEADLAEIAAARRRGTVETTIDVPGQTGAPPHKGELTFIDNAIDHATGTVVARATIANADFGLLPGQYVRVKVHLRDQPDALLVPQASVGAGQLGRYVFVVGDGDKVEQKLVTLGAVQGTSVVVAGGLSEHDRVITGNLQKIGPGMPVKPMPEAAPPS